MMQIFLPVAFKFNCWLNFVPANERLAPRPSNANNWFAVMHFPIKYLLLVQHSGLRRAGLQYAMRNGCGLILLQFVTGKCNE